MSDLPSFAKRVEAQLANVNREPHWEQGEAERYMIDVAARREQFDRMAMRLNGTVIRPRLKSLAGYFSNASLTENEPPGHCSCWFGYCEQRPATTKVTFSVEHDVRYDKVVVGIDVSMIPAFIKFNQHDKLVLSPDDVQDAIVSSWVEERLLEFLDAYLQIDRGGEDVEEEAVTDPVCGMRINRSSAIASGTHHGHPYYFCSKECHDSFVSDPDAHVDVRTM